MTGDRVRLVLPRGGFTLDVDFELPRGGITGLFGASGAGKTTVLRCIAGLERAPSGIVRIAGEAWQDETTFVPPWKRQLGYVFQDAKLFPHLDVKGNLAYARRRSGQRDANEHAVELLGIGPLLDRKVPTLSGGEMQRVAIARAIAAAPQLMLLDEPLASLDNARKAEVLPWLLRLRRESTLPMVYVSHSLDEIARLADDLVVLAEGRVVASGPVRDVLARIDASAALGDDAGALVDGRVAARDPRWHLVRIDFDGGALWLRDGGQAAGEPVRLRLPAKDVSVATTLPRDTSIQNVLAGIVEAIGEGPHPSQALVRMQCGGTALVALVTARAADALHLAPGQRVWAQVKSVAVVG